MVYVVDPFKETYSLYKYDFVNILDYLNYMCDEFGCFTKLDVYEKLCRLYEEYADSMQYEFIKPKLAWSHLAWTSIDDFDIACLLDTFHLYHSKYFLKIPWNKLEIAKEVDVDMPTKSFSFTLDNTKSCSITIDEAPFWYIGSLTSCPTFDIDKIYYNNETETIVVKWELGDKTKVQLSKGDFCNLWNGVCAAVMKRKYGSNSAFKTHIEKTMGLYDDTAYMILARAETCDIYHMSYNEFKDMVNEKLILSVKKK